MSEEGHTLKKGRSLGSTVNSEMSTNKIVDYALKFKAAVNFFFLSRFHTLRTSRTGMLLLPLLVTLVTAGASAAVVIVPTALSLPSIMWYNLIVVLIFVTTFLYSVAVLWAFRELFRFKEAWALVNSHTTLSNIQEAVDGTYGQSSKVMHLLLAVFIALNAALALESSWTLTETLLGTFPCSKSSFDLAGMGAFTTTPDMLTGVMDATAIEIFGLVMADGILTGSAPVPTVLPAKTFTVTGNGSCVAYKVSCEDTAVASNLTLTPIGTYSQLTDFFVSIRTFYFYIDIHMPTAGFDNLNVATPWAKQSCYVEGQLGKVLWTTAMQYDSWGNLPTGFQQSINISGVYISPQNFPNIYAAQVYPLLLARSKAPNAYSYATPATEGSVIISSTVRNIRAALDNVHYLPTNGGESDVGSTVMNWATDQSGVFQQNLVWHGLSAMLGMYNLAFY